VSDWPAAVKIIVLIFGMGTVGNTIIGVLVAPTGIFINRLSYDVQVAAATALYQVCGFVATTLVGLLVLELPWYAAVPCALFVALTTIATPKRRMFD
jgi:hypothetical protein